MIRFTPQQFEQYEQTLKQFLDSPDHKKVIIDHLCHSRKWLYDWGQTLHIQLMKNGKWVAPTNECWSSKSKFIMVISQASYHFRDMEKIGLSGVEEENFEVFLKRDYNEARAIAEKLYAFQEADIKQRTLDHFAYHKENGYMP